MLLASELADRTLDEIDEGAIEKYRQTRTATLSRRKRTLAAGSVNRELATLRRLLRLAYEWKVINRVPRIKLLRGEKSRESILQHGREAAYLASLPSPLADVASLLLDTDLRLGEVLEPRLGPGEAGACRSRSMRLPNGSLRQGKAQEIPFR